ncbi:Mediator of RNA polymerase II transcription subunit 12 [Ananas comosus]|uniref:Mediator of RNA polymerase II transcription subunit 12 n=1 Tax=Ananas comosus TaxID=4615 RepID=A0A199VFE0_ANACO|nr:Mediator of RNA polymerase II transcription subunit 12 [Ananas comosus]
MGGFLLGFGSEVLESRRQPQLAPYKLKCEKEPLNSRLGPPDFYPQTPTCPEETLTREYLQSGYKESVEGIEEVREIILSQVGYFIKPEVTLRCKEAIRKRFRAINESRAQKRKVDTSIVLSSRQLIYNAGQVYGVPLSGSLLIKPGVFPEQRPCGEDFRRKWIEALSQQHKRLRSLSEHVPHGYRRKSLFDVLIRHNVPLLRATWFIKVSYLNQVRPASTSVSSGAPDKAQATRTEQWTKDITDYLQQLLDEFLSKDGSAVPLSGRDQSSPGLMGQPPSAKHRAESSPVISEVEDTSFLFRWWYVVRLLQWHFAEGLVLPSLVIEWVFAQLQEKDSVDALELLLPIVLSMIESISLSQTYARTFVEITIRNLSDLSSGNLSLISSSKKTSVASTLVEMLRYMILSVPDTFVSLDCFPLPSHVAPDIYGRSNIEAVHFETRDAYVRYLSCGHAVSCIQRRASNLGKIVSPNLQGSSAAKVVQTLDKALTMGSMTLAYSSLFEDLSDPAMEERWIAEVSPCLRASLMWIGTIELSLICSIFFLCEWATCDYRDTRTTPSQNVKFTGRKDFSQIYVAVLLLKNKVQEMHSQLTSKNSAPLVIRNSGRSASLNDTSLQAAVVENPSFIRSCTKILDEKRINKKDIFQSPGPFHDIIVCWLDQHEICDSGGLKRVEVLILELIRSGIFHPQVYVRQLIVSGIMDRNDTQLDLERKRRHHKILKQLPASCLFDILEEARIAEAQLLHEVVAVYSTERRLVLRELSDGQSNYVSNRSERNSSGQKQNDHQAGTRDVKHGRTKEQVAQVKTLISNLLRFPYSSSLPIEARSDESKGSVKRPINSSDIKVDFAEGRPGCEECKGSKRQKLDERSSFQGILLNQSDDEDSWWVRKGPKFPESFKVEPPQKTTKQSSRGRQKIVRKTQSLAQLAAARIESSQGASTSHVCDNKVSCPHHKSVGEGEISKDFERGKVQSPVDVGKAIKRLRMVEKRSVALWLLKSVRQLVEGNEKAASKASVTSVFSASTDDRNAVRWRLGEDELLSVLYIFDICCDFVSAVRFLIWLLAKTLSGVSNPTQVGRNIMLPKNRESLICHVGEAFLLSSLQRYENVLVATDLLPEALTAIMPKSTNMIVGRVYGSVAFSYGRNLLKKYKDLVSVVRWEKNYRASGDQKLLAELDAGRSVDGDSVFSSGASAGGEEIDEHIRQKLSGRMPRTVTNMKEIVQRHVEEALHHFYGKERKNIATAPRTPPEKWEDSYQIAHDIVMGLLDCIRQNAGATPDGDPSVVASAVAAIVGNVGLAVAKLPDFSCSNYQNLPSSIKNSLNCARHILSIHIVSLCLLKEALGERYSRIIEIALAVEASSAVSVAFAPPRGHRSQFQVSPEAHDIYGNHSSEVLNNSQKGFGGRATKAAAAVSALVVGALIHGIISLERMIVVFKLKEGLDILQFMRNARSSSNGMSRSVGTFKPENCIELYVHWFRLLVGNCRTVLDGLVGEILGESYILALSRIQRMLPLSLVFPPAYAIFGMVIWRPYILNSNVIMREDIPVYQYLSLAIGEAIRHQPFRDVCFRNSYTFYDLLANDIGDSEFAAMLELQSPDKHLKTMAFIPLRARLFLNALIDCKMPASTIMKEDGSWVSESGELRSNTESEAKLLERLLQILDTLQPAKFHWQWVELRLLLNEQALVEKIETQNMSFVDAIRSLSPNAENFALTESEKRFTEIVLSRILVRPDAAPLYSEVVHLIGKLLQESLVMDTKWFLAGHDVLLGRKSIRQQLLFVAQRKGLPTKAQFWKPWGWSSLGEAVANRGEKRKLEAIAIEEGEVVDECIDHKKLGKMNSQTVDSEGVGSIYQHITEKAFAELILPCIDRSSSELRNLFATELIKQMGVIEQHISTITRNGMKQAGVASVGVEGTSNKANSRKGMRGGGSPVLGRRPTAVSDSVPPSAVALRASLSLRLQFLIRLLPVIFADREPSARNMRQALASIILRLLGSRVVYEDADLSLPPPNPSALKWDAESSMDACVTSLFDRPGESLFERLLSIFHALLSSCKPSWLKPKSAPKSTVKSPRDFPAFDREAAESIQMLQSDLDRMELPLTIKRRIQSAMPFLPPSLPSSIPCHPPILPPSALSPLQSTMLAPAPQQRTAQASRVPTNLSGRSKALPSLDPDMEIDPWTLLEDGTVSASTSSSGGNGSMGGVSVDHANFKACSWLKGAIRVRRTDLTYTGALDDDS